MKTPKIISIRRKQAGMSMRELARRCNLSHVFISQVESGRAGPSIASLRKIAKALGCKPGDLL